MSDGKVKKSASGQSNPKSVSNSTVNKSSNMSTKSKTNGQQHTDSGVVDGSQGVDVKQKKINTQDAQPNKTSPSSSLLKNDTLDGPGGLDQRVERLNLEENQSSENKNQRAKKSKNKAYKMVDWLTKSKDEQTPANNLDRSSLSSPDQTSDKISIPKKKGALSDSQSNINPFYGDQEDIPSRTLWIGNVSPRTTDQDIQREFSKFGELESLRVLHDKYCAFVNFVNMESAVEARKNLQGTILGGSTIVIHFRRVEPKSPPTNPTPQQPQPTPTSVNSPSVDYTTVLNAPSTAIWIGNISPELTEEDLWNEFSPFGNIENVRLLRQKTCAFVNFTHLEDAITALNALQGRIITGLPVRLNFGKPLNLPSVPTHYIPSQVPFWSDLHHYTMSVHHYGGAPYVPLQLNMFAPYMMQMNLGLCELCQTDMRDTTLQPCGHMCCRKCVLKLRQVSSPSESTDPSSSTTSPELGHRMLQCAFCSGIVTKFTPIAPIAIPYQPGYTLTPNDPTHASTDNRYST